MNNIHNILNENKEKVSKYFKEWKLNKIFLLIEDDLQMQEFIIEYLKDYNLIVLHLLIQKMQFRILKEQ